MTLQEYATYNRLEDVTEATQAPGMLESVSLSEPEWHSDLLFFWLDNRRLSGLEGSWTTVVEGVQIADEAAWVQVAPGGRPLTSVVLQLSKQTTAEDALAALELWAWLPFDRRPSIIRA